jgi:hypothetical protein
LSLSRADGGPRQGRVSRRRSTRVVGHADRFVLVVEPQDAEHRPEDLLPSDLGVRPDVGEDRRGDEETLGQLATETEPARDESTRCPLLRPGDDLQDPVGRAGVDYRPDRGRRRQRVTDDGIVDGPRDQRHELVVNRMVG